MIHWIRCIWMADQSWTSNPSVRIWQWGRWLRSHVEFGHRCRWKLKVARLAERLGVAEALLQRILQRVLGSKRKQCVCQFSVIITVVHWKSNTKKDHQGSELGFLDISENFIRLKSIKKFHNLIKKVTYFWRDNSSVQVPLLLLKFENLLRL